MAAPTTISVDIVASFAQFKQQLDQAGEATKGFADKVKSSLGSLTAPIEQIQSAMLAIGAIAAGGAAFKGLISATLETTGEVTKLQRAFGLGLDEANSLAGTLKLVGVATDDYQAAAFRLDRQIRSGSEAMQKLGFTAKDLDLGQKGLMDKAIAKWLEYKEGIDRNIAAQVMFGKGAEEMFAIARTAMAGVSERAKDLETQFQLTTTDDDKRRAREYKLAMTELGMAFTGIQKAIGEAVLPYLTKFAEWFSAQAPAMIGGMKAVVADVIGFAFDLAEGFVNFVVEVTYGIRNMVVAWQAVKEFFGQKTESLALFESLDGAARKMEMIRDKIVAALRDVRATITSGGPAASEPGFAPLPKGTKSAGGLLDETDNTKAVAKGYEGQIRELQNALQLKKALYEFDAKNFLMTENEKNTVVQARTKEAFDVELDLLQKQLALYRQGSAEYQTVLNKIKQLKGQQSLEMLRLDIQSIEVMKAKWTELFSTIQGAFNSQIRGLLAGTTSWATAFKNVLADLAVSAIQYFLKMGFEWAAVQLGMTTAAQSGALARAASEQAAIEATLPARAGKFISDLTAQSALVFAGVFANLAPVLGPAAAGPAAAAQATVLAELANVPKLDVGGYVLNDGLAMIHKGEVVTPANVASPYAGGGDGTSFGGVTIHNYGPKLSDADVLNALQRATRNKNKRW